MSEKGMENNKVTVIGTIVSGLYNDMQISAVDIAIIGQYAENVFFLGKFS